MKSQPNKTEENTYQTVYFHGVSVVCRNWVPHDKVITVTSPDEKGNQQVIITQLEQSKP